MAKLPKLLTQVTLLSVLAIGGGYLQAQPADEPAAPETPDVTQATGERVEMSPQEMSNQADTLIAEMQEMLKRVLEIQQAARAAKDVIKLNCVNDKLLQLKQLLNIADASRNNLIAATAQSNDSARYHEFNQIEISHEKVASLRDEAEGCIGDEIVFVGDTKVDVTRPPPVDDPTDDDGFDFEVEVPGYASPFI